MTFELLEPYSLTLICMALAGLLLLAQLIIADIAAIKAKHTAGYPIQADRSKFIFRSARAHANTNESISIFVIFSITGILLQANPQWLGLMSSIYIVGRIVHMTAYYADKKTIRSMAFGISLAALLWMFCLLMIKVL